MQTTDGREVRQPLAENVTVVDTSRDEGYRTIQPSFSSGYRMDLVTTHLRPRRSIHPDTLPSDIADRSDQSNGDVVYRIRVPTLNTVIDATGLRTASACAEFIWLRYRPDMPPQSVQHEAELADEPERTDGSRSLCVAVVMMMVVVAGLLALVLYQYMT